MSSRCHLHLNSSLKTTRLKFMKATSHVSSKQPVQSSSNLLQNISIYITHPRETSMPPISQTPGLFLSPPSNRKRYEMSSNIKSRPRKYIYNSKSISPSTIFPIKIIIRKSKRPATRGELVAVENLFSFT